MSSASITVSYTTLAEIGLVAAFIGGIAYVGSKPRAQHPLPAADSAQTKAKKANKKKKGALAQASESAAPLVDRAVDAASTAVNVVKAQPAVQKAAQAAQDAAVQATSRAQGAAKAVQNAVAGAGVSAGAGAGTSKKGKKKGGKASPPATSAGASAGTAERKPAAEVHATQKQPSPAGRTADMRDPDVDEPVHVARVLKVVGGKAGADPASLLQVPKGEDAWERADSFDEDDGEWESVTAKKPSRPSTPSSAALAAAPARSIPGLPSAPLSKKQRENAAKKTKEQIAREEKEREQEERLKQYRREQEKAKLAADQAARTRARPRSQNFFGSEPQAPAPKVIGGGMHAELDPSSGSLIWD